MNVASSAASDVGATSIRPRLAVAARVRLKPDPTGIARRSDTIMLGLAVVQGGLLVSVPSIPLIALGLWWNANTVAHNFIHRPFFRTRWANTTFSVYTTLLLGVPQTLWRERHVAHHAGRPWRLMWSTRLAIEIAALAALWIALAIRRPEFLLTTYLPGVLAGLALCGIQGHYEHTAGTTSHYGWLYNVLSFNDGYHAEHHAHPGLHWSALPAHVMRDARTSRWPPLLRVLDAISLEALERAVLMSPRLQRIVLHVHRRAFARALADAPRPRTIAIVGGGLFPRTALVLQTLVPDARLVVIDASRDNLDRASHFPGVRNDIEYRHRRFEAGDVVDCDLLVFPLSFQGDRNAVYARPPAPLVFVHDWLWHRRGASCIISIALLKRLNVVQRARR